MMTTSGPIYHRVNNLEIHLSRLTYLLENKFTELDAKILVLSQQLSADRHSDNINNNISNTASTLSLTQDEKSSNIIKVKLSQLNLNLRKIQQLTGVTRKLLCIRSVYGTIKRDLANFQLHSAIS